MSKGSASEDVKEAIIRGLQKRVKDLERLVAQQESPSRASDDAKDAVIRDLRSQVESLQRQLSEREVELFSLWRKNAETSKELEKATERLHMKEKINTATKYRQVQESFRNPGNLKSNSSLRQLSDTLKRKQREMTSPRDAAYHGDEIVKARELLANRLDAVPVANEMYQNGALTLDELATIQECHGGPSRSAELLIDIVKRQSYDMYQCFLSALQRVQEDIYVALMYKGMFAAFEADEAIIGFCDCYSVRVGVNLLLNMNTYMHY